MRNFLKIYFWQFLSVIFNLGSLFIITPYLSQSPSLYGIYTICLTSLLFFSYADLGFVTSAYRYASQYYIAKDVKSETTVTGFAFFLMLIFGLLYSLIIAWLAYHPQILFRNKLTETEALIAKHLFLILAFSATILVSQRFLQLIYGIRLKEYLLYRINLIFNILKIATIFYFFSSAKYDIVGYFLFMQLINLAGLLAGVFVAQKNFNYQFLLLIKSCKFSLKQFNITKKLAFSTFFLTISWILYYELDNFGISKLLGAQPLAIYAIGFSLLTLFRNFYGILYNPFNAKFNHLLGLKEFDKLKHLLSDLVKVFIPLFIFTIIICFILMKPIVQVWVGDKYEGSIAVARWLICCNLLGFISYPTGILMIALEDTKKINFIAVLAPLIYWIGVFLTVKYIGLISFAIFTCVVFAMMAIFYLKYLATFMGSFLIHDLKKCIIKLFLPTILLILAALACVDKLPTIKSYSNVLQVGLLGLVLFILSSLIYYLSFRDYRMRLKLLLRL